MMKDGACGKSKSLLCPSLFDTRVDGYGILVKSIIN